MVQPRLFCCIVLTWLVHVSYVHFIWFLQRSSNGFCVVSKNPIWTICMFSRPKNGSFSTEKFLRVYGNLSTVRIDWSGIRLTRNLKIDPVLKSCLKSFSIYVDCFSRSAIWLPSHHDSIYGFDMFDIFAKKGL